jgi:hypothetical protein
MLTIGTTIRRLNHFEYPAFEKMNQNGRMIKMTMINHMIGPIGPICMEYLLGMVCYSHLTANYLAKMRALHAFKYTACMFYLGQKRTSAILLIMMRTLDV